MGGPPSGNSQGVEKGEIVKDPQLTLLKMSAQAESSVGQLESGSTSSLSSNPSTTTTIATPPVPSLEDGGSSASSDQDQLQTPPITESATPTVTSQILPAMSLSSGGGDKATPTSQVVGSGSVQVLGKLSSEEGQGGKEGGGGGTNGGKKKTGRGKGKMMLSLVQVMPEDVVTCMLITKNEVKVNFQFSSRFDETKAIFKKLVSFVYSVTFGTLFTMCFLFSSRLTPVT